MFQKKLFPEVKGVIEVLGILTVHSAERANTEYSEVHAYRTGVAVKIPNGYYGLLDGTPEQAIAGVTLTKRIITPEESGELRVGILNNHRNAYEVNPGQPIARLYLLKKREESVEDFEEGDEEWDKLFAREELTDEQKEAVRRSGETTSEPPGTTHGNQYNTSLGGEPNAGGTTRNGGLIPDSGKVNASPGTNPNTAGVFADGPK